MAQCPICFSEIGTWTDDPILATPSLSIEEYEGFTQIKPTHIIELQNDRNLTETQLGMSLTTWTLVNNSSFYQNLKTYIKELRVATENILTNQGVSKDTYFNYDKDGIDMGTTQSDWHDVDLDSKLIQVKASHIEDLRHVCFRTLPAIPEVELRVHCHNPEGKEIESIYIPDQHADVWIYRKYDKKVVNNLSRQFNYDYAGFRGGLSSFNDYTPVSSISGVWLASDTEHTGTNYYTGGTFWHDTFDNCTIKLGLKPTIDNIFVRNNDNWFRLGRNCYEVSTIKVYRNGELMNDSNYTFYWWNMLNYTGTIVDGDIIKVTYVPEYINLLVSYESEDVDYVGIGIGPRDIASHPRVLITKGRPQTIRAIFNGMNEDIHITGETSPENLIFTFSRTIKNISSWMNHNFSTAFARNGIGISGMSYVSADISGALSGVGLAASVMCQNLTWELAYVDMTFNLAGNISPSSISIGPLDVTAIYYPWPGVPQGIGGAGGNIIQTPFLWPAYFVEDTWSTEEFTHYYVQQLSSSGDPGIYGAQMVVTFIDTGANYLIVQKYAGYSASKIPTGNHPVYFYYTCPYVMHFETCGYQESISYTAPEQSISFNGNDVVMSSVPYDIIGTAI